MDKGKDLLEQSQLDEAIAAFNEAIGLNENCREAFTSRSIALARQGRFQEAIDDTKRAIDLKPSSVLSSYRILLDAIASRNENRLVAGLRALGVAFGDRYMFLLTRSVMSLVKGKTRRALFLINKAIALNSTVIPGYAVRAGIFEELHDFDQAITDYNRVIESSHHDDLPLYFRACIFIKQQQYERAITDLNRAIQLNSKDADYYSARWQAHFALKRFSEAVADANQAINIEPSNTEHFRHRADGYYHIDKYDEAIEDYGRAINTKPDDFQALVSRALVFCSLERFDDAISDFTLATAAEDSIISAAGYCGRGLAHLSQSKANQAIDDFTLAIEIAPDEPNYYVRRGDARALYKDFDGAEADYRRAIDMDSKSTDAVCALADLSTDFFDKHDEAEKLYKQALEINSQDETALGNYAMFLNEVRGDEKQAAGLFKQALAQDPDDPHNLAAYGSFLLARNDIQGLEMVRRALDEVINERNNQDLAIECRFVLFLNEPESQVQRANLLELRRLLNDGVRSEPFSGSANIENAKRQGHAYSELLDTLASVIGGTVDLMELGGFQLWRELG